MKQKWLNKAKEHLKEQSNTKGVNYYNLHSKNVTPFSMNSEVNPNRL